MKAERRVMDSGERHARAIWAARSSSDEMVCSTSNSVIFLAEFQIIAIRKLGILKSMRRDCEERVSAIGPAMSSSDERVCLDVEFRDILC